MTEGENETSEGETKEVLIKVRRGKMKGRKGGERIMEAGV